MLSWPNLHYFPVAGPVFVGLIVLFALVMGLILLNVLTYAYGRMGIHKSVALLILLLSLLGGYVNLPLVQFPDAKIVTLQDTVHFGVRYVVPIIREWPGMVLAINVGGAVIPVVLSVYLTLRQRLLVSAFFCTAIVAAIVHVLARPVPGLGIAVPVYVPPVAAVVVALIASRRNAASIAYISGTLGTLMGGDLLNMRALLDSGAAVVSIGGAGMFDGIFLIGILAMLLACLATGRTERGSLPAGTG